jgi:excisionase family DNA binding protein
MTLEQQLEAAAQRGATRAVTLVLQQVTNQLGLLVIRPEDDTVLTLEESAAFLRVDPDTMRQLLRSEQISAAKVGNQWRIHKAALRRYLDPQILRLELLAQAAD